MARHLTPREMELVCRAIAAIDSGDAPAFERWRAQLRAAFAERPRAAASLHRSPVAGACWRLASRYRAEMCGRYLLKDVEEIDKVV